MDARMVKSRRALAEALLALLENRPFDQITIREITAKANIGYATFFRHYPTKEALLDDFAAGEVEALLQRSFPLLWAEGSAKAARALVDFVEERIGLWSALLTGGAAATVREEFIRRARQLAEQAEQPETWLPNDLKIIYGVGGTIDILAWWIPRREEISKDRLAGILVKLVIDPLIT